MDKSPSIYKCHTLDSITLDHSGAANMGLRNMTDNNVIPLHQQQKLSPQGWTEAEQTAITIAQAGALAPIDYERKRREIANQLKVRPSFLDAIVKNINRKTALYHYLNRIPYAVNPGSPLKVDGIMAFAVKASIETTTNTIHYLVIYSDLTTGWAERKQK